MVQQIIFIVFAAVLIGAALGVITSRNPVYSALYLVLAFVTSSGLWLLLEAEFLGIVLVLVYVGAVMVLFLFVVMMLDINLAPLREGFTRYLPVGVVMALLMILAMGLTLTRGKIGMAPPVTGQVGPGTGNTALLGKALYTDYLYPFEIAGAILLVAIIAAISLTMRKPKDLKTPRPELQVGVHSRDRVRLINLQSEKNE